MVVYDEHLHCAGYLETAKVVKICYLSYLQKQSPLLAIFNDLIQWLCPKSTAQYLPSWPPLVCAHDPDPNLVAPFPSTARWAPYDWYTEFCKAGRPSAMLSELPEKETVILLAL